MRAFILQVHRYLQRHGWGLAITMRDDQFEMHHNDGATVVVTFGADAFKGLTPAKAGDSLIRAAERLLRGGP